MQEEPLMQYIKNFAMRQVWRQRDAMPIISFNVELKDSTIKTGDFIRISTDEILQSDGKPINRATFQIIKREPKENTIALKAIWVPQRRLCFIAPNDTPDYISATEAQKEYGFITDSKGEISGEQGYYIY